MSEAHAGRDTLSVPEINLLELLDSAGCTLTGHDGSVRWALNAQEVCELLELVAVDLVAEWGGQTANAATVRARAAFLLGATTAVTVGRHRASR